MSSTLRFRREGARVRGVVVVASALALASLAAQAEPLVTLNQNPLVLPYGLPMPLPARLPAKGGGSAALDINWSNSANLESSGSDSFTLDAETVDIRLRLAYAPWQDWAFMVELPWRNLSGGNLDGFIENWHDFWNLPQGPRKHMPKDQLLIDYQRGGDALLHIEDSGFGIADVPIRAGYQLVSNEKSGLSAWLTVDLPTGDSDYLLGSGATDVALSLAGQTQLAEKWQLFGQVDAVYLGDGDIMPNDQQNFVVAGLAGVTWNAWRRLDLTVQFYANSKVFDVSENGLSGDAVVLSYGGTWRTEHGWRFDFGMNEDIDVEASPDVTFYCLIQKSF